MYASNFFENKMLSLMTGSSITAPSGMYLALFISNPSDTGSAGTECSYDGYARRQIIFSTPAASGSGMATQNTADITFPECTGGSQTVTYIGVFDSASVGSGNMYLYAQLTSSLIVQNGVSPVFRAGDLKWTWTGNFSTYYKTAIMNTLRGTNLSSFSPYIALCNGDPTGTGNEFSGNNYSRMAVTMTAPAEQSSGVCQTQNSAQIISAISSGAWGNLTHIAFYDAATNGNAFAVISVGGTYNIGANASVGFRAGELKLSVN